MKTNLRSAFEPTRWSRNTLMLHLHESAPQKLLAMVLSMTMFMASTVSMGFAQAANSSAAGIYKTNCVSCHAADGRGSAVGKSLHAADFHSSQVQQQSNAQLADVITHGRGNMPAFGNSLSKVQIDTLVKYLRSFRSAK
jgi:cytochrome c6